MKRNVLILAVSQALMMSGNTLLITATALVGLRIAPDPAWATVPFALMFAGLIITTYPASLLMQKLGRKPGFMIGAVLGVIGGMLSAWAVCNYSFVGFCIGGMFLGAFNAFGHYYRFAAAEAANDEFRSRAISYVLAGGVVAAFVGPNLAKISRQALDVEFAGIYVCIAIVYTGSFFLVQTLRLKRPVVVVSELQRLSVIDVIRKPVFLIAVLSAMVGYGVMNLLMTATPMAMTGHGFHFDQTANVVQWHVVGMFAPAFFTGHLIRKFGPYPVMIAGTIGLLACCLVNLGGVAYWQFILALFLLGVGWNFCFIGATSLLSEDSTEKGKVQGLNDLLVFFTVGLTALLSGQLHQRLGWELMNIAVIPGILLVMGILVRAMIRR